MLDARFCLEYGIPKQNVCLRNEISNWQRISKKCFEISGSTAFLKRQDRVNIAKI